MKLQQTILFQGSLDDVWDLFVDPVRWQRWNTEWAEIRNVRGPFDHAGAGYTQVLKMLGRERLGEWQVLACEPKRWRQVGGTLPLGIPFHGRDEFHVVPQGTEVSLELECALPLGALGRAAGRLLRPVLQRQIRTNGDRARELLREIEQAEQ